MKVLITSGGTKVPIDDVRHIGNMSTGRFGAEIAARFLEAKEDVVFFSEKNSRHPYSFVNDVFDLSTIEDHFEYITYKNYNEYLGVKDLIDGHKPDIIISAAAVSDYVLKDKIHGKISSDMNEITLNFIKAEKVISSFRSLAPNALIVGFKLLISPTYDQVYNAVQKVSNNGVDLVVYNDLTEIKKGNNSRLIFDKRMNFKKVADATELVKYIKDWAGEIYN